LISLVVAHDKNSGIGLNNQLPWGKPFAEDMRWFREHTLGKTVVMGRNTFESIGSPLKGRNSIILTKNPNYPVNQFEKCYLATSINHLIKFYYSEPFELVVIGGAQVYNLFLPYVSRFYVTEVDAQYKCDAYFSTHRNLKLKETYSKTTYDDKADVNLTFRIYQK